MLIPTYIQVEKLKSKGSALVLLGIHLLVTFITLIVMIEEEELDIDPDLFWFQKPGVVSAYRASGPEEGEEEPPGSPYFMNLSDYESEYGHAHAVKTVYHWEGPMDERGRVVEKVPWWAREEARERAKMLRADPPKTRSQTVATLK
ncbi:hypothetical protein Hanom_Chr01g00006991 [Helianthus anomalus]